MKNKSIISILLTILTCCIITSCDTDEPTSSSSSDKKQAITKPIFDKFLSTSDKVSFSIRVRFKTGGDKEQNMSAVVYWKAYSSKPSKTPSKSDLSKKETMRQYGTAVYHNSGSKKGLTESIVFDKTHVGYSGSYIYYYVECSNSEGSVNSSVTYMVAK